MRAVPPAAPVIHTGIDLAAPEGTPFYAAASGWVTLADYDRPTADANTRIIIQHDGRNEGYATDYLHWVASYVEEGDYVHAGDPIGEVGNVGFSTGPHLHFSVTDLKTGEFTDPLRWLPDEPGLEGYVSRMPTCAAETAGGNDRWSARIRRSRPTSAAGQGERAQVSSGDDTQGKPDEGKRGERDAKARKDSAANEAKRSGKKPSRDDAASEKSADESTSDAKNGQDRSRDARAIPERKRTDRHRKTPPAGTTARAAINRADSSKAERRENREASKDAGGGGKEEPTQEPRERAARDPEPGDSRGHDEQGGRDERGADRQEPDQGKPDGGGNDSNRERHRKS